VSYLNEIIWHGRGGQGAKTVAEFLALVALREGKYSQGFPEYGPERSGAPMRGYTRVSDAPIKMHSAVYHPNAVLVLDATLLNTIDVTEGMEGAGAVLINTPLSPGEITSRHSFLAGKKVWTVDATGIARAEIGRPIPNMPMLGALVKATGVVQLESVVRDVRQEFQDKFAPRVLEGNLTAIAKAFQEVRSS
jgi:pyruvate ferredoxin oxidoreductase gamma subunit